jgi:TonB family protein
MRRVALLACSCLLPLAASTQAQSSDQALKDFRTQVLTQRLILQNFSADPVTNFEWTATGLASNPPKVRTLGVFTFSSAKLHNDSLELTGSRSTIVEDVNGNPSLTGQAPVVVKIALKGADATLAFPSLRSELFFPTLQAAMAAIPPQYRQMLSQPDRPRKKRLSPLSPPCPLASAHYEPPHVVHIEQPEFSEEARRARFSGSVTIIMTVDEGGHPSDLWLKFPAGLGLDEQAIKAVSNYTFKPATCDGTAVKTPLAGEVNFAIG